MLTWDRALRLSGVELYLDSPEPKPACFISHAHSDHLGIHQRSIATAATAAFAGHRVGLADATCVEFRNPYDFDHETRLELLPAGHVFQGAPMLHVTRLEGTLLYTGDFKLRSSLTVPQAEPVEADVLVMESTYGQPMFRFPAWESVAEQLVKLASSAMRHGRQPIVMGYSLGKAQEITRILSHAGIPVTLHGRRGA